MRCTEFKSGDKVYITKFTTNQQWEALNFVRGCPVTISNVHCEEGTGSQCPKKKPCKECEQLYFKIVELNQMSFAPCHLTKVTGGFKMNQIIINAFPKTAEAVIVDKWFGSKLNDPLYALLIKGKEAEILSEATRLEEEAKAKK
jgi:hypothetical protein